VETFTEPRALVRHAGYAADRQAALDALDLSAVDPPVIDVVEAFRPLPYCFTLQACHGHFLTAPGQDEHSLEPVPDGYTGSVRYRIAYVVFCVQDTERGRAFKDQAVLTAGEAMRTQRARDRFFEELRRLLTEEAARY